METQIETLIKDTPLQGEQIRAVGKTQCSGCKRYFNGINAFENHRIGEHGKSRRRMSDEEMRKAGMEVEQKQVWMYMENKKVFEVHPVWYSVVARERTATLWNQVDEADNLE